MGVKKIIYGNKILIDLSTDTVTPDKLQLGYTAHNNLGEIITGTFVNSLLVPYISDFNSGYVTEGTFYYESPTNNYSDIYIVTGGHRYFITLGETVSTRFRVMFTNTDISKVNSDITGTNILNRNNPVSYDNVSYEPSENGYLVIGKSNVRRAGIKTYVYDAKIGWL